MTLVLEIEYLSGVSFSSVGPDHPQPEWPPQPDRIFSALVASWGARGENGEEARMLEWLETLPAPRIRAGHASKRTVAVSFVPPNDPRSDLKKNAKWVLPQWRGRQARTFPAARLHDPLVRLTWPDAEVDSRKLSVLNEVAAHTSYVGHSASLTRCRFITDVEGNSDGDAAPRRRIYPGRLAELRNAFINGRRPLNGSPVIEAPSVTERVAAGVFGESWLVLEHIGGVMPDVRAAAVVAKSIHKAILSGYARIGLSDQIPEIVSGHTKEGRPTSNIHISLVPLAFTGFPFADGHVLGYALVPPRDSTILKDETFLQAIRSLAPLDEATGRRVMTIYGWGDSESSNLFEVSLSPTLEFSRHSLNPRLYTGVGRTYATVTPLVLDRHVKRKGSAREEEIEQLIADACLRTGLPRPERIVAHKHSMFEGVPSAWPSGSGPDWTRWRLPNALSSRQLTHAVFTFNEPVKGPVIIGAGRFLGLGLCRPLREARP